MTRWRFKGAELNACLTEQFRTGRRLFGRRLRRGRRLRWRRRGSRRGAGGGRLGRRRIGGRSGLRLRCRVDPTGMDAEVEAARHLVVDGPAKPRQASERRLDVAARTPKAVVEIEVAKGGIEVVKPHQANDTAAEPDAFGIAGRTVNGLGGFRELVGF